VRCTKIAHKTALALSYSRVGHHANFVLPSRLTLDRDSHYQGEVGCQIMTDTSSVATTNPSTQPFPVTTATYASPIVNGFLSDTNVPEEEDYTIKCICTYEDDDGNTVFCENCETWQHIECYYPGGNVPELHFCADCRPRSLDGKRATERQKRLREQSDGGDRKSKRPASSKSGHKKKTKPSSTLLEQTNGWHKHERHDSSAIARDQPPPAKRPKTSHHASGSVSSLNGTPKIPDSRKRTFSNGQSYPSPTKSLQDHPHTISIPMYTRDFLELYERDQGKDNVSADGENFHTLSVTTKLSAWQRDPLSLAEEIARHEVDAFIPLEQGLDRSTWPEVSLEYKTNTDVEYEGKYPSWHLLRLKTDVRKGQIVGEIRGAIGELAEYCQDPSNRFQELRHPEPFVFFHPSMPIYIDSRREGTKFRYLRRSCRPNVTLKTYTTREGQCNYCFVALQDLSAGTELTAQWYMQPMNQEVKRDDAELWASRLLANFGDCQCDKMEPCLLATLDHRRSPKILEANTKLQSRTKKAKNKQAISPLSTGQATNSRAGSENNQLQDDDEQADSRSVSGSSRSKSQSRDETPTNVGILDADPVLGLEMTAREKKKIAMMEKSFQKLEQGRNVQKKKKRTSGGSTLNTPTAGSSHQPGQISLSIPSTPSIGGRPVASYADTSTSNRYSGSPPPLKSINAHRRSNETPRKTSAPNTPSPLSPFPRPNYVDHSVQTEPDETEQGDLPPPKRRKFSTPNQRLLKRVLEDRARFDELRAENSTNQLDSTPSPQLPSPATSKSSEDVEMKDAYGLNSSPRYSPTFGRRSLDSASTITNTTARLASTLLPSQAAHSFTHLYPPNGQRLQLSTLPPVPSFSSATTSVNPAPTASPIVKTPSGAQSTFSFPAASNSCTGLSASTVAPSPVKKKLSLGDYMSRMSNLATTPTVEKTHSQVIESNPPTAQSQDPLRKISPLAEERTAPSSVMVKPNESLKEEALSTGNAEGSAISDTPLKEEPAADTLTRTLSTPQFIPVKSNDSIPPTRPPATTPSVISPEIANVLSHLNALIPVSGSRRSHSASSS
jgi:uncharacterized protein